MSKVSLRRSLSGADSLALSLIEAAKEGNLESVRYLLASHVIKVNTCWPPDNYSAMHWACLHGDVEIVAELLHFGSSVRLKAQSGWTPMMLAAMRGHEACIEMIFPYGVNIDEKDEKGSTSVHKAAAHGRAQALLMLHKLGANVTVRDVMGRTPAHVAALHGHLNTLQYLIKWGVDLAVVDDEGNTASHLAASEGYLAILRFIVSSGGVNTIITNNNQGNTPLMLAKKFNRNNCLQYLQFVVHEMEHPLEDDKERFPLHAAASIGDLDAVKTLILEGVSLLTQDIYGSTALHKAAGNGHVHVVRYLLQKGANLRIHNHGGESARDVALRFGHVGCARVLGGDSFDPDAARANASAGDDTLDVKEEKKEEEEEETPEDIKDRLFIEISNHKANMEEAKLLYRKMGGILEEDLAEERRKLQHEKELQGLRLDIDRERLKREKLEGVCDLLRREIFDLKVSLSSAQSDLALLPAPQYIDTSEPSSPLMTSPNSSAPSSSDTFRHRPVMKKASSSGSLSKNTSSSSFPRSSRRTSLSPPKLN